MLVYRRVFSQMVVKNGDESHGTIRKQVNKSKPSKLTFLSSLKAKPMESLENLSLQFGSTTKHTVDGQNPAPPRMMIIQLFIGFLTIPGAGFRPSTASVASHLDLHQKKKQSPPITGQCHPLKKWLKWNPPQAPQRVPYKVTSPSSNMCFFLGTETNSLPWPCFPTKKGNSPILRGRKLTMAINHWTQLTLNFSRQRTVDFPHHFLAKKLRRKLKVPSASMALESWVWRDISNENMGNITMNLLGLFQ